MTFNLFYCGGGLWNARPWLELTKADTGGIVIMEKKAEILPVYVENLYCAAANILKQELLSLGGELAVYRYAVNCKVEYGDVLILATSKQYRLLYKKLAMQYWKLKELGQELRIVINNISLTGKLKIQSLDENGYKGLISQALIFQPSGEIIKDLARLPLLEIDSAQSNLIIFNTGDFSDLQVMRQYILAIQSKGYRILVKCRETEEKWVSQFLCPNYVYKQSPYIFA